AIRTDDGYSATLLHLGSIAVARGASVAEGTPVGTVGASGTPVAGPPYVYFGVRVLSDAQGYVDPLTLLPPRGNEPPAPAPPPARRRHLPRRPRRRSRPRPRLPRARPPAPAPEIRPLPRSGRRPSTSTRPRGGRRAPLRRPARPLPRARRLPCPRRRTRRGPCRHGTPPFGRTRQRSRRRSRAGACAGRRSRRRPSCLHVRRRASAVWRRIRSPPGRARSSSASRPRRRRRPRPARRRLLGGSPSPIRGRRG